MLQVLIIKVLVIVAKPFHLKELEMTSHFSLILRENILWAHINISKTIYISATLLKFWDFYFMIIQDTINIICTILI